MSRSLGLREDQRVGTELAMLIAGLFPVRRLQYSALYMRFSTASLPRTTCFHSP